MTLNTKAHVQIVSTNLFQLEALPEKMKYKVTYCFQGTYIRAMLVDAYKFAGNNWDVEFSNKVSMFTSYSMRQLISSTHDLGSISISAEISSRKLSRQPVYIFDMKMFAGHQHNLAAV